jgi:hypothetical protein
MGFYVEVAENADWESGKSVFLVLEEGAVTLTHHLSVDNEGDCVSALASFSGCRLVEADYSSSARTKKRPSNRLCISYSAHVSASTHKISSLM